VWCTIQTVVTEQMWNGEKELRVGPGSDLPGGCGFNSPNDFLTLRVSVDLSSWGSIMLHFWWFFPLLQLLCDPKICYKCVCGRGSAPDPAGGAYDAPPNPLVGWGGGYPLPIPRRLNPLAYRRPPWTAPRFWKWGDNFASGARKKIFDPPLFGQWGGQNIA